MYCFSPKNTRKDLGNFDTESALVSLEKKNSYLLEKACQLLQISPERRTNEEINLLVKAFENNKYFKSSYSDNFSYKEFIKMCTDHLKYEYFEPNSTICHYGEIGTKFYIILKGSIDCFILKTEEEINRDIAELTKPKEIAEILNQSENLQNDLKVIKEKLIKYNENVTEIKLKKGNTMFFQKNVLDFFTNIHSLNPKYYDDVKVLKSEPDKIDLYFYQDFCRFKKIRVMYAGDFFGEIALTLSKPRIATITARESLHLASLNKEDYNKIFENQIEEMNQKMKCFLSQFNTFSKDAIIKFTYEFKPINFNSHQIIFKQGDESNLVFLVKTGGVKLVKNIENEEKNPRFSLDYNPNLVRQKKKDEFKQILIALISQNEFFGEDDVIKRTRRSYTAIATQSTEAYYITSDVLHSMRKNQKEFYDVIREKAAIKEKWKRERIATLEHTSIKMKGHKKRRDFSVGLRGFETFNPANKNPAKTSSESFKYETIRGSTENHSPYKAKTFLENVQKQNPTLKYKKLTIELINHIVKKNKKIMKLNANNVDLNEKNTLFEYFRNNKYQENYLRAKLSQKASKSQDLGLSQKNGSLYATPQTLMMLKKIKNRNTSATEESFQEKENEAKTVTEPSNLIKFNKKISINPTPINPYQLASTQTQFIKGENDSESCVTSNSLKSGLINLAGSLMSSNHNMFRIRPKNYYIMKNYYKI